MIRDVYAMKQDEQNKVSLYGRVCDVRSRWTPDGSLAVIASLLMPRPALGTARASAQKNQPMPLRATGSQAKIILEHEDCFLTVEGCLRRRYYSREGDPCWGQVEIWVNHCQNIEEKKL